MGGAYEGAGAVDEGEEHQGRFSTRGRIGGALRGRLGARGVGGGWGMRMEWIGRGCELLLFFFLWVVEAWGSWLMGWEGRVSSMRRSGWGRGCMFLNRGRSRTWSEKGVIHRGDPYDDVDMMRDGDQGKLHRHGVRQRRFRDRQARRTDVGEGRRCELGSYSVQ